ncbi:hypothetical protein JY651_27335 [Pyxidicoccus parkwayensis]|uniref:Uncharacterized protein n=1 Tax=Pyxidicoccus parkwayensis TaxID=2813578 RepID=A0ABX7NJP5_9BACT|nr:hypothetical protein [Pyxidicoccus parkwaysis]QSQ19061.1 hypothetical protein JY651_27335 [Pyxidicoccus parkwaysis]
MPAESVDTLEPLDAREELRAELSLLALIREAMDLAREVGEMPPSELNDITGALRDARDATLRRVAIQSRAYVIRLEEPASRAPPPAAVDEATFH